MKLLESLKLQLEQELEELKPIVEDAYKKYKEVNFTYQQKQNEYLDLLLSIKNPKK